MSEEPDPIYLKVEHKDKKPLTKKEFENIKIKYTNKKHKEQLSEKKFVNSGLFEVTLLPKKRDYIILEFIPYHGNLELNVPKEKLRFPTREDARDDIIKFLNQKEYLAKSYNLEDLLRITAVIQR
ncbi:hypothetical protein KY341_02535 [Candidatus Woesearchaeota archaeon]|nr:hypothetical protein [Candidatus Woesearchaeota archaeon]